jgi:hypothetical protein
MKRKRILWVSATLAIIACLSGVFLLGQRIAARHHKEEQIREIEDRLTELKREASRIEFVRQRNGIGGPDPVQQHDVAAEVNRFTKERDQLQKELRGSDVWLPFKSIP